jgi:hypothetical protein
MFPFPTKSMLRAARAGSEYPAQEKAARKTTIAALLMSDLVPNLLDA